MLHITDGESVAGTLRQSELLGDVAIFGDLLYEGPAPANLAPAEWLEVRAAFLANGGYATLAEARRYFRGFQETLAAISEHEETVLWFDHRLSDQLMLIQLLASLPPQSYDGGFLSLVPVPDAPFTGFGHLPASELASLAVTRRPVSATQFRAASEAWAAFTSPDPTAIERVIESGIEPLPFLAAALHRHLEEFPSTTNGLSRTEQQALSILRARGPLHPRQLYAAVHQTEDPVFMGDLSFLRILLDLDKASTPLVNTVSESSSHTIDLSTAAAPFDVISTVSISAAGRSVLDDTADAISLNGIDRWLGGVHLQGREAAWRWNPASQLLVRA